MRPTKEEIRAYAPFADPYVLIPEDYYIGYFLTENMNSTASEPNNRYAAHLGSFSTSSGKQVDLGMSKCLASRIYGEDSRRAACGENFTACRGGYLPKKAMT